MTTRRQVQPDWEAFRDSMETIGDLSNLSVDPEKLPPFAEWITKVIKGVESSKERDAIGVILEYEVKCRTFENENEKFKHIRKGIPQSSNNVLLTYKNNNQKQLCVLEAGAK